MKFIKFSFIILGLLVSALTFADNTAKEIKLSEDAQEQLRNLKSATVEEIAKIRENSELNVEEIKEIQSNAADNRMATLEDYYFKKSDQSASQGRHSRPNTAPQGALYVDIYEESRVLIDYTGRGNQVQPMTFAVVTKYTDSNTPFFVRAQLVSTGMEGHRTPRGQFNIDSRHRYYVSNKYGSRMDYAQFFIEGVAIHQTPASNYQFLGAPASHGCVRHHVKDALAMWLLIGNAQSDGVVVNIQVHRPGEEVILADGSKGTNTAGFGEKLNNYINDSYACNRRAMADHCNDTWEKWSK